MAYIEVDGGNSLYGEITIQGSKNSTLPILAACVLCKEPITIKGCPKIQDVFSMLKLLEGIGYSVQWNEDILILKGNLLAADFIIREYAKNMRSSIILLGAMLGRVGRATICYPGGCSIGKRPIDLHLKAFRKMNVKVKEKEDWITCSSKELTGGKISLDFPSVGATENILLAAVLAKGTTVIENAAKEPEIKELCRFLRAMGAKIHGEGTDTITVIGVEKLHGVTFQISSDRIATGTFLAAITGAKGAVKLHTTCGNELEEVIDVLRTMGADIKVHTNYITCYMEERCKSVPLIRTRPYPGFPTDLQSPILAVLSTAEGTSMIIENIFEDRFKTVEELKKLGAQIKVDGRAAVVEGVSSLHGLPVKGYDLRGTAALIIAGLMAKGTTRIENIAYLDRGYEDLCISLRKIGASIRRID